MSGIRKTVGELCDALGIKLGEPPPTQPWPPWWTERPYKDPAFRYAMIQEMEREHLFNMRRWRYRGDPVMRFFASVAIGGAAAVQRTTMMSMHSALVMLELEQ